MLKVCYTCLQIVYSLSFDSLLCMMLVSIRRCNPCAQIATLPIGKVGWILEFKVLTMHFAARPSADAVGQVPLSCWASKL